MDSLKSAGVQWYAVVDDFDADDPFICAMFDCITHAQAYLDDNDTWGSYRVVSLTMPRRHFSIAALTASEEQEAINA